MIYRRAPGLYRTPSPVDGIAPAALLIAGVAAITAAALTSRDKGDASLGTGLVIGGSAAAIGGGVWAYEVSRATQRDGAATVWQLSAPAPHSLPAPAPLAPQPPPSVTDSQGQ